MDKAEWTKRIKRACRASGTYQAQYHDVVETLAEILQRRDEAAEVYQAGGANPVIQYTNKAGATNMSKNPALILWDDLNKSALAYWRELGLTPSSYRKMTGDGPHPEKGGALTQALKSIEIE